MKRLWLADVHANLPAFEAVLADAGHVDEVIFLGDIVGFGPHPAACVERLMGLDALAVQGNHDAAVLAQRGHPPAPGEPLNWDQWTLRQLDEAQLSYLQALPEALAISSCGEPATALHQLPGAPYLHPAMPDAVLASHVRDLPQSLTLCGHSHRALDRTIAGRRLICLPSIGQPRNSDPRAGYALEQDGRVTFHTVAYDVERVAADVAQIGLPEPFCGRWINFVRTASDPDWSREYQPDDRQ